jgi:hypothetical protein
VKNIEIPPIKGPQMNISFIKPRFLRAISNNYWAKQTQNHGSLKCPNSPKTGRQQVAMGLAENGAKILMI